MRPGETVCYYRPRGGKKSIYITIFYENDTLRESIIERQEREHKSLIIRESTK